MSDEVSSNEVNRRLDRFEAHVNKRFDDLDNTLHDVGLVRRSEFEAVVLRLDQRITDVGADVAENQERFRWLSRTVGAASIAAVVNVIVLLLSLRGG